MDRSFHKKTIVDQVKKAVGDLLFRELVGLLIEVANEFTNFTQVAIVGSLRPVEKFQIEAHLLS